MSEMPENVSTTLRLVLESYQLQLESDPGLASMGGPDNEQVEEALAWVKENE
jgi:hypothetical protein